MTRAYKTEGIILKRVNFGETDRILTIFTKHCGKIKALAKGIRKLKSRKAGNLELFNHAVLVLSEGKGLDIITETWVVDSFVKLRRNLSSIGRAFQIAEVTDKLTAEREANRRVFELLLEALKGQKTVREFEIELLKELGFGLPKKLSEKSVENFNESIIEKRLKSKRIFPTPIFPIPDRTKEAIQ